jgi:hypothetical protein
MKEQDFLTELLRKVFPFIKKNYELIEMKKRLKQLDRVRQRMKERIKELEQEVKNEQTKFH